MLRCDCLDSKCDVCFPIKKEKMNIQVYYHGYCSDGFGAAYAAWRTLGDTANYLHLIHGRKLAKQAWIADEIYFLDGVPEVEQVQELLENGKRVTIIDHHQTNLEAYKNFDHPLLTKKFDLSFSGAVLSWFHFQGSEQVPELLKYVEDYDLWKKELPGSAEVAAGLRIEPFDFLAWHALILDGKDGIKDLHDNGEIVIRTEQRAYRRQMKEVTWHKIGGILVPFINVTVGWNEATNEMLQTLKVNVAGYYFDRSDIRVFGLRGDGTINVGDLAKNYGGGGHANSAGFQIPLNDLCGDNWI